MASGSRVGKTLPPGGNVSVSGDVGVVLDETVFLLPSEGRGHGCRTHSEHNSHYTTENSLAPSVRSAKIGKPCVRTRCLCLSQIRIPNA